MHVQVLKELAKSARSFTFEWQRDVKNAMCNISSMDPKPEDLVDLRTATTNIFPVRTSNGMIGPTNCQVAFVIHDRDELARLFPNVKALDIPVNALHAHRNFLNAMGLSARFMSALVKEETTTNGGARSSKLTQYFRERAHALYR